MIHLHFRCNLKQRDLNEKLRNIPGDFRPRTRQFFLALAMGEFFSSSHCNAQEAQPTKGTLVHVANSLAKAEVAEPRDTQGPSCLYASDCHTAAGEEMDLKDLFHSLV